MALEIDADEVGVFAVMTCDKRSCPEHVAARPAELPLDVREMAEVVIDWALDEGWLMVGRTYCPKHRGPHEGDSVGTVGEGRSWAPVASPVVNRAPRPS